MYEMYIILCTLRDVMLKQKLNIYIVTFAIRMFSLDVVYLLNNQVVYVFDLFI